MKQLDGTGMKRLHRDWRRRTTGRLSIVLDSVQNPYNVGSILRTAAALRVDHIWFAGGSETPAHAKTQKTALGADRYVTWTETAEVTTAGEQARASGLRLVGLELADEAQPLHTLDLTGDICLVVGHEDRGLSKAAIALCDTVGYVPLLGKIGSLNVAMAASIALYEIRRQAWTATPTPP